MLQVFPHIDTEMATSTVQYICGHKFYQNIFLFLIYRYLQDTNNISTTTAWTLSWAVFFVMGSEYGRDLCKNYQIFKSLWPKWQKVEQIFNNCLKSC